MSLPDEFPHSKLPPLTGAPSSATAGFQCQVRTFAQAEMLTSLQRVSTDIRDWAIRIQDELREDVLCLRDARRISVAPRRSLLYYQQALTGFGVLIDLLRSQGVDDEAINRAVKPGFVVFWIDRR